MMQPRQLKDDERIRAGDFRTVASNDFNAAGYYAVGEHDYGLPAGVFHGATFRRRAILVLGHGGHGKGELCKLLTELYGAECLSSSEAALPHIFPALQAALSYTTQPYPSDLAEAHELRHLCRDVWKELIALYNTPDKTTLAREVLSRADVYDGMRCVKEFEASRHLFDYIVWVDASARVPTVDPTLTISRDVADLVIDNNGTLDDLRGAAVRLGERLGVV